MDRFKVLNFQNFNIDNAINCTKPFEEASFDANDLSLVFVRNPYEYFDFYLHQCIFEEMSPKLAKQTIKMMKKLSSEEFLAWFETLHYIPLINPQTFQLNMKKKIDEALINLQCFNYIVPYEAYPVFLDNLDTDITITEAKNIKKMPFSILDAKDTPYSKHFLSKDIELYEKAHGLWQRIQENQFKPLHLEIKRNVFTDASPKYEGRVRMIDASTIEGWVFKKGESDPLEIMIYKNDALLQTYRANLSRPHIKKVMGHPTDRFGFNIKFDQPTFQGSDKIEVIIVNTNVIISLEEKAKQFFKR